MRNHQRYRRIMELLFPRTFAPKSESTIGGTFAPWYFRSLELSFPGTFVPWNFRSRERKLHGTFAPWNFRSLELSLPVTICISPLNFRLRTNTIKRITVAPSTKECSSLPTNVPLQSVLASRHATRDYMVSAKITKS